MPERLIDIPIESLPLVDEHSTEVDAPQDRVWEALLEMIVDAGSGRAGRLVARGLGCRHTEPDGEPGEIGSTIPGFIIAREIAPAVLALMGEHRWSHYALIFRIEPSPGGALPTRLVAETRAEFPGRTGGIYRMLVIGSRGHVLATRSILRSIRRRAERD